MVKKVVGYKTVNLVNGHYYYGVRTLIGDNDKYLGSGVRLAEAIKLYGKQNFKRFDLVTFKTFEEALAWEREIVTEQMVKDPNCYNLKPGGAGGSLPWSEERKQKVKEDGSYKKSNKTKQKMRELALKRFENSPGTFNGKLHTQETKVKMSLLRQEQKSSTKGKKAVSKDGKVKYVDPKQVDSFLQEGWVRGNKVLAGKEKSEEHKQKIRTTLSRILSDEQVRYLQTEFVDTFGARTKLAKEWNVSLENLAKYLGRRYKNKRSTYNP